ncbi:MAG: HAMP domain-containing histidine kinase [Planctomycetes bacterium]|nr:HAMP domain-containing histidine kinase [Planctomycetota bacterium]
MGRLLWFGQQNDAWVAFLRGLYPRLEVVTLDVGDVAAFAPHAPEPAVVVVDIARGHEWSLALLAIVSRRFPKCEVVALDDGSAHGAKAAAAGARLLPKNASLADAAELLEHVANIPLDEEEPVAAPRTARPAAPATSAPPAIAATPPSPAPAPPAAAAPAAPPAPVVAETPAPAPARPAARAADLEALALLVRGLTHEINNPLTTIRGLLQLRLLGQNGNAKDHEAVEAYRTMERESKRIAELTEDLEFFTGLRKPTRTLVDVERLVRDALKSAGLETIRPLVVANGAGSDFTLLVDREQLTHAMARVIEFLTANADVKPCDLSVRLIRKSDGVTVEAAASCRHLATVHPDRLLLPFQNTVSSDRTRKKSLAAVYGIARAHGGSFDVKSSEDGHLELRLFLPVALVN